MTVLLPFLTFLIDDFHVAPTPEDIGSYSGYLVSSFMLGQLLFSYLWGWLSDRYGRRPVMLIGLFLTGTSFLSFGFSTTYSMALIIRFLNGSLNGIIGATKTYLSEITDESNQARGFALFGVARGLGMVSGPIVGGFLCLPAEKYPFLFPKGSLFDLYPYALPCVVGWVIAMAGCGLGCFVLEETNNTLLEVQLPIPSATPWVSASEAETQPLLATQKPRPKTFLEMLKMKKVVLTLTLYTLSSFIFIQFDELFALWSRLPYDEGGLEFDSSVMGQAYSIGGISLFFYQTFFFSPIERYLGTLKTFQTGILFSLPSFVLLPIAGLVRDNTVLLWMVIALAQILRACAGVQAMTSTFLMISNSITSESRGSLNGIGQTMGSLGRLIGPVWCGVLFSWSLENHLGFPLDYHFVFLLSSVILLSIFFISLLMPADIDQRIPELKPNQDEHNQPPPCLDVDTDIVCTSSEEEIASQPSDS
ncbi:hypothetical protein HDV03_005214, partial [Kappamyces sp. JEL0829]